MPLPIPSNAQEAISMADFDSKNALLPKSTPIVCDGLLFHGRGLVIEGRAVYGAGKGLRVTAVRNGLQAGNAAVKLVGGKLFNAEVDTCDGTGIGVYGLNSVVAACHIHHCGQNGIACSSAKVNPVHGQPDKNSDNQNALFAYNEIHEINTGLASPVWAGAGDTFNLNGKWYVNPGWEAMGIGKFAWCSGVRVIGNHVYRVHGPGIWGDVYGWKTLIAGNLVHECFGIKEAFMGMGISNELMFETTIRGNVCYGNSGSDIQTAESADVLIEDNWVEEIEMRALAGRTPGHKNVTVRDNRVRDKIFFSVGSGAWTNLNNVVGSVDMPSLSVGPENAPADLAVPELPAPPPVDPPPVPAIPNPDGASMPPLQHLIDGKGRRVTLSAGGIYFDGVGPGVTKNVVEVFLYGGGKVGQKANGKFYGQKVDGGWYELSADPRLPVEPPVEPPSEIPPEVAQLQAALAAERTRRLAAEAAEKLARDAALLDRSALEALRNGVRAGVLKIEQALAELADMTA